MMRMQDTHSEQDEDDSSTLSLLNWCLLCGTVTLPLTCHRCFTCGWYLTGLDASTAAVGIILTAIDHVNQVGTTLTATLCFHHVETCLLASLTVIILFSS